MCKELLKVTEGYLQHHISLVLNTECHHVWFYWPCEDEWRLLKYWCKG